MRWPWNKKKEEGVKENIGPDWLYNPTPIDELREQGRENLRTGQPLTQEQQLRLNLNRMYLELIWEKVRLLR